MPASAAATMSKAPPTTGNTIDALVDRRDSYRSHLV